MNKKETIEIIKKLTNLTTKYNKLIKKREYKGQYILAEQIKPLLLRLQKSTNVALSELEENEEIRKEVN